MEKAKREQGLSLIELLLVVAIIGIITAAAIPALHSARQKSQAASAIQSLKVICSSQLLYERKHTVYGTMTQLLSENILDPQIATGKKSEYGFTLTIGGNGKSFTATAQPLAFTSRADFFFIDESGVIRFNKGAPADVNSPPIPR